MVSLTEFADTNRRRPGPACSVCVLRETQPELYAEVVKAKQRANPISSQVISNYLRTHSQLIGQWTISNHFRQEH